MTLGSSLAKTFACTIQPKTSFSKRPPAASHSAWVETPSGPKTGRPFFLVCHADSSLPLGGRHQLMCLCHCATLRGTRLSRSFSENRLGAVYIAPTRTNFPAASFLYSSDVGFSGLNLNAFSNPHR